MASKVVAKFQNMTNTEPSIFSWVQAGLGHIVEGQGRGALLIRNKDQWSLTCSLLILGYEIELNFPQNLRLVGEKCNVVYGIVKYL